MQILHRRRAARLLSVLILATSMLLPLSGDDQAPSGQAHPQHQSPEAIRIINKIIAGEKLYENERRQYSPRVETYVQYYEKDSTLGEVPRKDAYFLGRLQVAANTKEISFIRDTFFEWLRRRVDIVIERLHLNEFAVEPLVVDKDNFDVDHYTFTPVRWEYLGEIRCLAIDLRPRRRSEGRPFEGRIWVEDQNYAIVRLNGVRLNAPHGDYYVHFDCWRENIRPGVWLPVYIFSNESDRGGLFRYKAETRLWGYDVNSWRPPQTNAAENRHTRVHIFKRQKNAPDMATEEAQRRLDIAQEHNVVKRLERAGLIAPPGPVDKVLETVVNNLVIANHLEKLPPVECRVLLTSTLESFSLAYTIVLSRGLIDVLPDEPSLAMILAHELGHITSPHGLDTRYALTAGMDVPDEKLLASLDLARNRKDEVAADAKGVEFLKKSLYKDNLNQAGLFLEAATRAAQHTPHLFGAHIGNGLLEGSRNKIRMEALTAGAPELKPKNVDQIAALPLGSRIVVNAWDGSVAFSERKAVALLAPSEKLPFEVSPVFPYLKLFGLTGKIVVTSEK